MEQAAASALPPCLYPEIERKLTMREQQILALLLQGCTSTEIASTLSLSVSTVKTHRKKVFKKFNINKLSELFVKCNR